MDIYSILSSKPHNPHYLKRYVRFIESCQCATGEKHHICPKAKDLFPEYASFSKSPWNKKTLTSRHHFIAHWMLWKAFHGSQSIAFWRMCKDKIRSSRVYESIRTEESKRSSDRMLILSAEGNHPMQKESNIERHHWKQDSHRIAVSQRHRDLASKGLHASQSESFKELHSKRNAELVSKGVHYFQSKEHSEQISKLTSSRNSASASRENVRELKKLMIERNVSFGRGWHQRSDEWINLKILDLSNPS